MPDMPDLFGQDHVNAYLESDGECGHDWMNGTKIVDVTDKSTLPDEAAWREPQSINIQMPYTPGVNIKYRNIRIRTL